MKFYKTCNYELRDRTSKQTDRTDRQTNTQRLLDFIDIYTYLFNIYRGI